MASDSIKGGNFLTNWIIDRVYDSTTKNEQGEYEAGWGHSLLGNAIGLDVDAIETDKQTTDTRLAGERALDQAGFTAQELQPYGFVEGQGASSVTSAVRNRQEAKAEERDTKAHDRSLAGTRLTLEENNAVRAHESKESRADRALERELGNMQTDMQMQMKFIEKDIANKRLEYDRETRRMDRRDAMIAQLMKGIGQLGGAFSL